LGGFERLLEWIGPAFFTHRMSVCPIVEMWLSAISSGFYLAVIMRFIFFIFYFLFFIFYFLFFIFYFLFFIFYFLFFIFYFLFFIFYFYFYFFYRFVFALDETG